MPQQSSNAYSIGTLMCQTTRDILWAQTEERVQQKRPGAGLALRVGSGLATYHRFDPRKNQHLITYGARMIAAKHEPATAQGWLSTREIRGRGYFGGQVSVLNLLAHTCCHEFAHLLQHSAGQRHYGSVHNRHFYAALDGLHQNGTALAIREHLTGLAHEVGLDIPNSTLLLPDPAAARRHWQVGDTVSFGEGRHEKQGEITRVNRKTCTVMVRQQSRCFRYRVPLPLLTPLT